MHLKDYTAEDFALHQEFRMWVLCPNRELNAFWSEWLLMYPEKLVSIEQARLLVENTPFKMDRLSDYEINILIGNIESVLNEEEIVFEKEAIPLNSYAITDKLPKRSAQHSRRIWIYCAAAIALLLASISFFDFGFHSSQQEKDIYTTKVSPLGQISVFNIPDGSRVWLSAGSSLKFLENFTPSSREIYLEGEAYFEVAKDSTRPFTVHSGNISTTALGTSFNVNYFAENAFTDVSLLTGKVVVEYHSDSNTTNTDLILTPGEVARLDVDKETLIKGSFEPGSAASWKDGVIYFKDATFQNVKGALQRMYNIEIKTINSSDHTWSYNGRFDNENLPLVLKKIALTEGFEFTIKKNQVEIIFNR